MILLPAIDLVGGKAVRLYQGDYDKMTVYRDDPLDMVREFDAAGAGWLHLVDLDGAKSGGTENRSVIRRIVENTSLRVELGGGIRSMERVSDYLDMGVSRVVLGTAAVQDPDFAARAAEQYGPRIAVGADARDGFVAVKGWTEQSSLRIKDFCRDMYHRGVRTFVCTDISRDGALMGVNTDFYRALTGAVPAETLVASGGVSSLEDIRALAALQLGGAIAGKALYTGALELRAALAAGKEADA